MLNSNIEILNANVRVASYYLLFYIAIGSFSPFSALWFQSLDISPTMSGAIFAASPITTVLFTVFIGAWADRLKDWRSSIIACNWVVLVGICWLLYRQGPWDLLFVWALTGLFTRASGPIIDAAALHATQKTGSDFGRIRSFGPMGFLIGVLLAGVLFNYLGIEWFVTVLIAGAIVRVFSSHLLPKFKSGYSIKKPTLNKSGRLVILQRPGVLMVLLGSSLISSSHSFNNMFSLVHWSNIGINTTVASILVSVGFISEVLLMWKFRSLTKKISARVCLLIAATVCIGRWYLMGTDPTVSQLFALQALNSITFGLAFLATVNFIAKRVDENNAAQAQSEYAVLLTLTQAIIIWLSGWMFGQFAGQSYWAMATLALFGGAFVLLSYLSSVDDAADFQ